MDTQFYSPKEVLETFKDNVVDPVQLAKPDYALRILPPETNFAIVAVVIERAESESFWEVSSTMLPTPTATISSDSSIRGRFTGYFALIGSNLVVYRADGTVAAQSAVNAASVDLQNGAYILHTGGQKFRIEGNGRIYGDIPFESNSTGLNDGLNPFFDKLRAGGAKIAVNSNKKNIAIWIVVLLLAVGVSVVIVLSGHK